MLVRIIKKITANCNTQQTRQNNMMGSDMSVVRIVKFVATTTGSLFAKCARALTWIWKVVQIERCFTAD